MGWFGKKKDKKEKSVPFWRRGRETENLVETDAPESTEEAEEIAAAALEEQETQEQDEIERARQAALEAAEKSELRKEAIALARQAAIQASGETEEAPEPAEDSAEDDAVPEKMPEAEEPEQPEESPEAEAPEQDAEAEETEPAEASEDAEPAEEPAEASEPEEAEQPEESEDISGESEEVPEEEPEKPKKKGFFAKIRDGLRKTKDAMIARMQQVVNTFTKIDDDLFDQLEETMIMSDLGPETSVEICETLRKRVKERGVTDPSLIMGMIQEIITEMLGEDQTLEYPTKPTVVVVIGVNGAGKTTTIGKLCHQLKSEGKKVLVAAADTFRAAAIDQLEVWTQRAGVDIVKHAEGSDPASVVYDAIDAAKARGCDVLICDTAGRLHNKKNLMQELAKINRIIETRAEGCHQEVLLVLDATTGQNAVNQARLFQEVANITGIVLTKLDGTAKGGIIVSIRNELGIPVKLIGVGEKIEDLQPFHAEDFVRALFVPTEEESE